MTNGFMQWLNTVFTEEGYQHHPFDGLSEEERIIAKRIGKEYEKASIYKSYSKLYLQSMEGTENFYEMSINALSALIKIGDLGSEIMDVVLLCEKILDIFSEELEFENCSIMLVEDNKKHLRLIAGKGKGDKYEPVKKLKRGRTIKIGEGIAGKVAKTGEHIFIPDVSKDMRFKDMETDITVSSLLCIPVTSREDIIGVINFSHPILESFDKDTINLMLLLSNFVGQMITLTELNNKLAGWGETLKAEVDKKTSELKKMNRKIENSLKEKEALFREMHHRVKNNLQVIISLLEFQSEYIRDEGDKEIFNDSKRRIKAMAFIHEKLYHSKNFSNIDFNAYIYELAGYLFNSFGVDSDRIALDFNITCDFPLIDKAIYCGLIINELVANSLKYAFPHDRGGKISIALHKRGNNDFELIVGDNGVGIPDDIDFRHTGTLGLHLVTGLVENQLHGGVVLNREGGTEFKIRFKEK